ncbi:hypothetical protein ACQP04_02530 [Pseudonocardia halophobica]|uniref:hypothetical protein n=1 Tax=Pseudonocardia halophobica TaxID=29401 RepID=UPI003D93E1D2
MAVARFGLRLARQHGRLLPDPAVAQYLSVRHGLLLRWVADELAARLFAHPRICDTGASAAREEFFALASAVAIREGAAVLSGPVALTAGC